MCERERGGESEGERERERGREREERERKRKLMKCLFCSQSLIAIPFVKQESITNAQEGEYESF